MKGGYMAKTTFSDWLRKNDFVSNINWEQVEAHLGFCIHSDLKNCYTKIIHKTIEGQIDFVEKDFLEETGDERNDTWISFNQCEGYVPYELFPLGTSPKDIEGAFTLWTGGNDFGHRAMIGTFSFNIGEISILFNNDTGKVEWIDCGYGYFDTYEENPNGILAQSISEFFRKLQTVSCTEYPDTQISYWMGYEEFVQLAQFATERGCLILKNDVDGKLLYETDANAITKNVYDYYFYIPQAGTLQTTCIGKKEWVDLTSSAHLFIRAGFSYIDKKKRKITRGRLYSRPCSYFEELPRPDCVTTLYHDLVDFVKKIAPTTKITDSYLSTKAQDFLQECTWIRTSYITSSLLELTEHENYNISTDYRWDEGYYEWINSEALEDIDD